MSAFLITTLIGIILGHDGRVISWIFGIILILVVILLSLLIFGASAFVFFTAWSAILGYNFGLAIILSSLFLLDQKSIDIKFK